MERGKPHLLTLRRCHTPFVSPAELRVGTETDKRKEAHAALICWANTVTTVPLPSPRSPSLLLALKSNLPNIARALSNNDPEKVAKHIERRLSAWTRSLSRGVYAMSI